LNILLLALLQAEPSSGYRLQWITTVHLWVISVCWYSSYFVSLSMHAIVLYHLVWCTYAVIFCLKVRWWWDTLERCQLPRKDRFYLALLMVP